jgi:arsenite-transporting ATPase
MESAAAAAIRKRLPGLALIQVMARRSEPTGIRTLAQIGREIQRAQPPLAARTTGPRGRWRASLPHGASVDFGSIVALDRARLVLFGGKGGVGKTTCAAAASIAVARRVSPRPVVVVSTDPAHSLADAFGTPLSDVPSAIPGAPSNLRAREMDAAAGFRAVRTRYAEAVDALFADLSRGNGSVGFDVGHDRRVMQGLIDLAPPGIDELAAVIEVTDAVESRPDDIVIMDTAPSGHALRLLEMPALVQDWTKALMSIVLKYQPVVGVGEFGATLLKLSQGLGRLRALLVDPNRAAFVVVTRAAALPRAETIRLLARLTAMRIHVPAIVINAVGRGRCRACRAEARAEQREIAALRRRLPRGVQAMIAPAQLPPPHASRALGAWYEAWRSQG